MSDFFKNFVFLGSFLPARVTYFNVGGQNGVIFVVEVLITLKCLEDLIQV